MTAPDATFPLLTDLSLSYRLVNPDLASGARRVLLLLHGVGSNELDLLPVGEQLADAHTLVLTVQSPLAFGPAGFCFYQVNFVGGQRVPDPAQQQASRRWLLDFMREVTGRYGIPAGQVYLLGFSQGAVMAYDVALRHPAQVRGVLAFSGRLLAESRQHHAPAVDIRPVRFFLSHGRSDELMPPVYVEEALAFLRGLGVTPHYEAFAGGHEVPAGSVAAARAWLAAQA